MRKDVGVGIHGENVGSEKEWRSGEKKVNSVLKWTDYLPNREGLPFELRPPFDRRLR